MSATRPPSDGRPASVAAEGERPFVGTVPVRMQRAADEPGGVPEAPACTPPPATRAVPGGDVPGLDGDVAPWLAQEGSELFGYRLCRELGRGAFARVFLA